MSEIESFNASGSPSAEEQHALLAALEQMLAEDAKSSKASRWKLQGRMMSLGLAPTEHHQLPGWEMAGRIGWRAGTHNIKGRGEAK